MAEVVDSNGDTWSFALRFLSSMKYEKWADISRRWDVQLSPSGHFRLSEKIGQKLRDEWMGVRDVA